MHDHCGCGHTLKHCKTCDMVYCETRKAEWTRKWGNTFLFTGGAGGTSATTTNFPLYSTCHS